jgi:hypothetical protein
VKVPLPAINVPLPDARQLHGGSGIVAAETAR